MAKASIKLHGEGACPHAPQAGRAVAPRPPPLVRLGDVCAQVRGVSYKPRDARDEFAAGYVPLLRANNIGENGLNHDEIVYVKRECVKDFQFLHPGDLLVCASSGSRHLVGKAAQILSDEQETFGAFCKVVRPDPQRILPDYLAQYFQSDVYRRTIANKAAGANINNIRSEHIDDLQIPLPPLPEQKRIAAILDKICEMKRNAEARLQKLDLLVKARFVEMFGEGKFVERELISVTSFVDYRGKTPTKSDCGIPLITAKNVRANGFSIEPREYMPEALFEGWMSRGFPRVGDVLFTTEAPLGNVCRIPDLNGRFAVGQRIVTMQVKQEVLDAAYLEHALKSESFQRKIKQKSSGSTVTGIRSKLLEKLTIPIPPLALQRQFAAFVEKVEGLKATAKKELEQVDLLYRAKLQEFFG